MINDLTLLSGNEIPFIELGVSIHNPTIKEIAYVGEENFFIGRDLLNFSKDELEEQDKVNLKDKTDFDILIAILREHNAVMKKNRDCVLMVLALLFPTLQINFEEQAIVLTNETTKETYKIDNSNFDVFKKTFNQIFNFGLDKGAQSEFNPSGELARKIAAKLKKGRQKVQEAKHTNKKIAIISRYVSILAVGEHKDMNELLNYTVYQLFDEFKRYELKMGYDIYLQARMAGAKDLKEIEDWMQDIHE
jgi:hypothetical protein